MSPPVNLYYVRAAIEANTGIRLSLRKTKQYLIEEKLIPAGADASEFRGYSEFYWTDDATTLSLQEDPQDVREDIDLALRLMK
jgi:hypothetical protein|tara:strand:+ start:1095 stop:1343 length:249 start_codon:yes stop_codon:yes gene_type:complete